MPKPRAVPIILILTMAISAVVIYPQLPPEIPTHFGVSGRPDEWGPKMAIFLLPGLSALVYMLLLGLPRIDPFRRNYERFSHIYEYMEAVILAMFTLFYVLTLVAVFFSRLPIDRLLMAGVSMIFILMGNKLGAVVVVTTIYSYIIWRQLHHERNSTLQL